jgi:hypothetical protein
MVSALRAEQEMILLAADQGQQSSSLSVLRATGIRPLHRQGPTSSFHWVSRLLLDRISFRCSGVQSNSLLFCT